ncbi:uncharacterized protein VTP21DRAFT_4850 [Calcarisporiella thermophila]|uniref:uncharacterized protein n=1 Tax=Calcarisporiella thermophila TaxID=911321 RepID=UPI003742C84C
MLHHTVEGGTTYCAREESEPGLVAAVLGSVSAKAVRFSAIWKLSKKYAHKRNGGAIHPMMSTVDELIAERQWRRFFALERERWSIGPRLQQSIRESGQARFKLRQAISPSGLIWFIRNWAPILASHSGAGHAG